MNLIARGLIMWQLEGDRGLGLNVHLDKTPEGMATAVHQLGFRAGGPSLLISKKVPDKWTSEFTDFLHFLFHLRRLRSGRISHDYAAINDLAGLDEGERRSAIGAITGFDTISGVTMWHSESESKIVVNRTESSFDIKVVTNLDELAKKYTPMDIIELILRVVHAANYSKYTYHGISFEDAATHGNATPSFLDAIAWLKILKRYHQFRTENQDDGSSFNLIGEAAKAHFEELGGAFDRLAIQDYDAVQSSISRHNSWIIELSQRGGDKGKVEQPRATEVTIIATPQAKLIHFDGTPELGTQHWMKLMRALLAAPDGVTHITMAGIWDSDRPELVVSPGEERWYMLNPAYAKSRNDGRRKYREALEVIRRLCTDYPKAIGTPSPEPSMSKSGFAALNFKILGLFHTDRERHAEFIDIGRDRLREVMEALAVLKEFHK